MNIFKGLLGCKNNKPTKSIETLEFINKGLKRKIAELNRDIAAKDQYIALLESKLKNK